MRGVPPFWCTRLDLPPPPRPGEGCSRATGPRALAQSWVPCRDMLPLEEQLASIQDEIDVYSQLDVVWKPYLGEGDEGQPWLEQARPYFGRATWVHALNLVLPLHLHLTQSRVDTLNGQVDTSPRFQKTQLPDWKSVLTQSQAVLTLDPVPRRPVLRKWDSVSIHSLVVSTQST
ncbi:hypothetical protein Taro_026110 [Colocasia esculenta]|uniref:Uncharacterized protein n=1 Tax=Colocasia esculenta TaxID=4460 RepID=A0A843VQD3_COLES|nr:hypothetical protein [Colocasia esculenta]